MIVEIISKVLTKIVEIIIEALAAKSYIGILVIVIFGLPLLYLCFKKYRWLLDILRYGGIKAYYPKFPLQENPQIWNGAKESIKYLGISAQTILPSFKYWVATLPSNFDIKFYFLLMDPSAKAFSKQLAYEKNLDDPAKVDPNEVAIISKRVQNAIDELKTLEVYKRGKLKIKIYDEFVPWWMYILDDEVIYLGLLPKGISGIDAPLLKLKKLSSHITLFTSFHNTWERLWESAKDI